MLPMSHLFLCSLDKKKQLYYYNNTIRKKRGKIMAYQKLSKKSLGCMYIGTLIEIIITTGILLGVRYLLENRIIGNFHTPEWILMGLLILVPIEIICSLISPIIRYARYRYILTEEELEVREGILVITREIVPIERVHKIEVNAGPIDRMFGLAKVKVVTAGGEVTARFLEEEKAQAIADTLKKRINHLVLEQREKCDGAE